MIRAISYTGMTADVFRKGIAAMIDPKAWADAFKSIANTAIKLKNNVKRDFFSSLLTVVLAMFCYAGWHVVNQGSMTNGLKAAFVWSGETKAGAAGQRLASQLQAEIKLTQHANKLIQTKLQSLVAATPGASRSRVHVIHNGVFTVTGVGLLRYDVTHAAARAGRAPGAYETNTPLSQMTDYLDTLIDHKCKRVEVTSLKDPGASFKMNELGVSVFLACPIYNTANQLIGALLTHWDGGDALPEDMPAVISAHTQMAAQIAIALDLKHSVE